MNREAFAPPSLAQRLARVEHFAGLSASQLTEIISAGVIRRYQAEGLIFLDGDPSSGLYVLLSGRVQLCKLSLQGHVSILALFEPVIMFNEVAALDGGPNPATAIALEDCVIWQLPHDRLEEMILKYPRVGLGLVQVLAKRNRRLVGQFEDLSFRSVLARSAKLLLELSQNGMYVIERRRNPNYRLAAQIATVPEAFSRSLKVFRRAGCIQTTAAYIRIIDTTKLAEIAQVGPQQAE